MIVFTSVNDDNFGNPGRTNKSGTHPAPTIGDWGGISFEPGSDSTSALNYCRVTYASLPWAHYYHATWYYQGEVSIFNASPTISNCNIGDATYGIYAALASNPKILSDSIFNTTYTPVAMSVSANPTLSGIVFKNTAWTGLGLLGEYVATNGEVMQRNVAGYTNITYVILADITINTGTYVTVDPGVVIKSDGPGIYVNGGFKAKGTRSVPTWLSSRRSMIRTTAIRNIRAAAVELRHQKQGIGARFGSRVRAMMLSVSSIVASSSSVEITSCPKRHNGAWGLVTFTDASGTLSNSTLSDSYNFGIRCENSSTSFVSNVSISNCKSDPIGMSLLSNPTFTGITFTSNASKGIRILEGTLSSNATLATRNLAGITNVGYIVDQLTIGPSAVLTIQPGVVIKFMFNYADYQYDYAINVQGALVADGTATQPIVFTSMKDDSYGGDTNNDGSSSTAAPADWCSVDFTASSLDSLNSMKHCIARYGGYHYWYVTGQYYQHGMVRAFNCNAVMDSSTLELSSTSGFGVFGNGHPTVTNTQMVNTAYTPVTISMFSNPTFTNITASNAGYMAIGIAPETYSVNGTVPIRNFAGYNNITYSFTIPAQ